MQLDSSVVTAWPLVVPFELEKKYNDVGVAIAVTKVNDKTAAADTTAKYSDIVTFSVALANNGNQNIIPTFTFKVPAELVLTDETKAKCKELSSGTFELAADAIGPGKSIAVPLLMKVKSLSESATASVPIMLTQLTLDEDKTIVPDENSANDNASAMLKIKNPPTILTKIDALTKVPLEGAEIQILKDNKALKWKKLDNGAWVIDANGQENIITGKDGILTVYGLEPASFAVCEVKAPTGYAQPKKDWTIKRDEQGVTTGDLELMNEPLAIELMKYDSLNNTLLQNAEFTLADKDGKTLKFKKQSDGVWNLDTTGTEIVVTDYFGKFVLRYMPLGEYTLTETKAPDGYAIAIPIRITISTAHGSSTPYKIAVPDKPLTVRILKVTRDNIPLSGAGFQIKQQGYFTKALTFSKDAKGNYRFDQTGKENTIMVNAQGEAVVYCLPIGEYQLEESIVPDGYFAMPPQRIIVTNKNDIEKPLVVTAVNDPIVKLGFDSDRYRLPVIICIEVVALAGVGFGIFHVIRRRR